MNKYSDLAKKNPFDAEVDGDWIVIAIHKDSLQVLLDKHEGIPALEKSYGNTTIDGINNFMQEVVDDLNEINEEDGHTTISRIFEEAAYWAYVDNGCFEEEE